MDSRLLGVAALCFTVLTWGMSGVAIKTVSASGLVTAFYRLWFAIPLLWLTMLSPSLRRRLGRPWLFASLIGGSLFGFHQVLYFSSLKLTSVANVTIIGALQPALVLLVAGPIFGERVTGRAIFWSVLAFTGTLVVVLGAVRAPSWSLAGDVLAWVNLFAFTGYFLASKRFRTHVGPWEYVVGMTTVSGIVMFIANVATGQDLASPQGWDWAILVAIAVFPGTLGHALMNWAHAHVTAFVASMVLLAVPVVATLGAYVFLGERFRTIQAVGAALVLTAIAMIVTSTRRPVSKTLAESAAETDAP